MKTSDEKKYIYAMMQTITEERRELTKIYYELKSRLDEIDELERRGLEDISVKGYVDLHNARDIKRVATNLRRETEHTIKKMETESVAEKTLTIPKSEIENEKERVSIDS